MEEQVTDAEQEGMRRVVYRSVLGFLLYLSTTSGIDISSPVSLLDKKQEMPASMN